MTDRNEYEGIDFRVKVAKQKPNVASALAWISGCIALVSLLLFLVQYRSSGADRQKLQSLQSHTDAQSKMVATLQNENSSFKQQLAQLETALDQAREQLKTCRPVTGTSKQPHPQKLRKPTPSKTTP